MVFSLFDHSWKRNGMMRDSIKIENVKGFSNICIDFDYPESNFIVVTGKNGVGKTTLVKSLSLIKDPSVFQRTSGDKSIDIDSKIEFCLFEHKKITFSYNSQHDSLDTRDSLPDERYILSELPIPYGERFKRFSLISSFDSEIRASIASSEYCEADEMIEFLSGVYKSDKFSSLKKVNLGKNDFYIKLKDDDFYIREDHFSSGEFFLIQLYRLIVSDSSLVVIDEVDIALDASAQINLYSALKPLLKKYRTRLIVVSHSLAFMSAVDEGCLYYLEDGENGPTLERRSFGYIKSDLYGFQGRERYILTEDKVLLGFLEYIIKKHITPFFQYEIIPVGGQPQIDSIAERNDKYSIFGDSDKVVIFIDKDISDKIKYRGPSKVFFSPVDDIEVYLWRNRESFLSDVVLKPFKEADKEKKTAKTYWDKILSSKSKTTDDLYEIIENNFKEDLGNIVCLIKAHLCLE